MSADSKKPWLDNKGRMKSEEEIKESCKNWGPTVWEKYLTTLEVSRREDSVFCSNEIIDSFTPEQCTGLIFSMVSEEKFPLLKIALNSCIQELTTKQKNIIRKYYWEGKSLSEISLDCGVSKQAVHKTMKAAQIQLKESLTKGELKKRVYALKDILSAEVSERLTKVT